MAGMYMGPSSAFGGAFGGGGGSVGPVGARPITQGGPTGKAASPLPGTGNGSVGPVSAGGPFTSGTPTPNVPPAPGSVLGPTAVRASGPSQGFDPSYLQNLATSIGGLFSNSKQGGNVMNVNPLENLGDISPASGMEGNAPQAGLPQTWLQQALAGLGFSFGPPPAAATTVTPNAPVVGSANNPGSRGNIPNYPSIA